jgi:hypothetical protein
VPLPIDPRVIVRGVRAESAHVFKSAKQPIGTCVVRTYTISCIQCVVGADMLTRARTRAALEFFVVTGGTYRVIFKSGDDLRQDQVCCCVL